MKKGIILLLLILAVKSNASINFDDGNYHLIDYSITDWVDVDYFNKPDPGTRVDIVAGGLLVQGLKSYGNSEVTVLGGIITEDIILQRYKSSRFSGG